MSYGKSVKNTPDDITRHVHELAKTLSQLAAIHDAIIDKSSEEVPDLWEIKKPHTFPELERILQKAIVRLGRFSDYLNRIRP